jgi:hypothetical protein
VVADLVGFSERDGGHDDGEGGGVTDATDELARTLIAQEQATAQLPIYLPAVVVGALDDQHMQVDLGGAQLVPAYLPRTVGYCRTGQAVRVRLQENTYTIAEVNSSIQWDTGGFTYASGWQDFGLASGQAQRCGWRVISGIGVVRLTLMRTGAITASSTGHLADIDVVAIPPAAVPTWAGLFPLHWKTSTTSGGGMLDTTTGMCRLTDLNSSSKVSTGDYIATVITYPLWTTGV